MTHLLATTAAAAILFLAAPAFAQTAPATAPAQIPNVNALPTDANCETRLTAAGQQGEAQRMAGAAEVLSNESKPSELSCLGDVLDGAGLDLFGTGFDVMGMLNRVKNQACASAVGVLSSMKSQSQGCGIYASGWNMGLPGFGTGQLCRSVYVGGGGGEIFGAGTRRPSTGFGSVFGRSPDWSNPGR
ncbi:MAG: hypothetical protein ING19_07315 [Azospirillum sp.]|nr:hypothetical protein [Azospirillum sp.]MCA3265865.1 hypothetical protein [Azospirillum sp.]